MNIFKTNKISKSEFIKLNEEDLMFITNPGRMGDSVGKIILNDNIKLFKDIYDTMESWNITLVNK